MVISSFDCTSSCAGEGGIVSGFCSRCRCGGGGPEPSRQHPLQPAHRSCRQPGCSGKHAAALQEGSCAGPGSWNLSATWRIDPGALTYPLTFPSQVSVLPQRRRCDLGHELKEGAVTGWHRQILCKASKNGECVHACVGASLPAAEAPGKGLQEQLGAACAVLPPCRHLSCF